MTSDAILVVQCLFSIIWSLFTSWYIPGTNVTPAQFFLFLGSSVLGITFVVRLLTVNPSVSSQRVNDLKQKYYEREGTLNLLGSLSKKDDD